MLRKVSVLQVALLLCSWGGRAQDFMLPDVNIVTELGKLKNLEERLKTQEETLQNQNILVTLLKSSVEELTRENGDLKMKVEALQNKSDARNVAFSASLLASGSGNTGPFSQVTSPLIYKKVFTNYGNGYDPITGVFTAPLKGVYYLRFYAHCHGGTKMAVSLYKNDKVQCSVFSLKPENNANAGNGIVLTLEKGDRIYTKLWNNAWLYDDEASYTSFGGFLIVPL
ncbi:complement component 1, q subcomponent-like 4 like [Salminus brasiliensis]|uniref:complement component 1, q subcomponent-like 4 like n=1 Tax=Salminus brasiliensis TaxID=930266 RepID=UPI003B830B6A